MQRTQKPLVTVTLVMVPVRMQERLVIATLVQTELRLVLMPVRPETLPQLIPPQKRLTHHLQMYPRKMATPHLKKEMVKHNRHS
jgi:hypothetical protein